MFTSGALATMWSAVLALAPVAFPVVVLRRRPTLVEPLQEDRRRPELRIADGQNPYDVWMQTRGLDVKTVVRRMDLGAGSALWRHGQKTADTEASFVAAFLNGWNNPDVTRSAYDIVAFCRAVDITPDRLVDKNADLFKDEIIEACVYYNQSYISIGHDKVTQFLKSVQAKAKKAIDPANGDAGVAWLGVVHDWFSTQQARNAMRLHAQAEYIVANFYGIKSQAIRNTLRF